MILVTGGTGLVGSHLLYKLLQTEESVKATFRSGSDLEYVKHIFSYYTTSEIANSLFTKIEWILADLNDVPALNTAFEGVTSVYHCAALVSFQTSNKDLRKINIEGTANIVNFCISFGVKKLCFISSIATMDPSLGTNKISENFTWYPEKYHSDYAITKHGAETEVWRASQEGLAVIILNPGVILGPGFWKAGSGQIFSRIEKGLKYHFPKITGFVGVENVADLAIISMQSNVENEQFIVVSENRSFESIFSEVAKNLNKPQPTRALKPWMIKTGYIFQSIGKLFGLKRSFSREDSSSLFAESNYKNKKAREMFNFRFTPINEVIRKTSEAFKKEIR